jgi:hypothetical protein
MWTRSNRSTTRVVVLVAMLFVTAVPAVRTSRAQDTPSWNKPKPPVTKPKPVAVKPKPVAAKPKPVAAKPKPVAAKTKPRPVVRPATTPPPPQPLLPHLAAQYRVLKVNDNNTQVEVSPVTIFGRGDRLRLAVKSAQDVYLFVIHQKAVGQPGRIYLPESQGSGGLVSLKQDVELVIPSGCPADASPAACSYQVDAGAGQEVFTIIFSRTPSFPLLEEAGRSGHVTQRALDALTSGLTQRVDDAARGDTVFARRYSNLGPRSPDQLVVRFVLNKRG